MLSSDERLFFIHIPKTAGTTLIPLLDMRFAEREICPAQLWREMVRLPQDDLPRYRLFRGHFGGDGLTPFLPQPPTCITMLRHPLWLALSTYGFIRREPGTRVHRLVHEQKMDLGAFLDHSETRGKISNKQTRHLSFSLEHDPEPGPIFLHDESLAVIDAWVRNHRVRIPPQERFARARAKLESCAFFGLVERFEDSMALLCHTFGWPPVGPVQKLMVAPDGARSEREEVTDAIRDRILHLNEQDLELYAIAERRFDERVAAMREQLMSYIQPDEDPPPLLTLLDRHSLAQRKTAAAATPPPQRLRIDLDEPLFGDGWHRREPSSLDGTTFRWTGPGTIATMDVHVARSSDLRITLRLINALTQEIYDGFRLRANGEEIPLDLIESRSSVRILQGVIPARALGMGDRPFVRLEFCVGSTVAPCEVDRGNADTRRVGVALNWIDLAPEGEAPAGEVPRMELKPEQERALRERKRAAIMAQLKQRVASIPVVGPRLRSAYIRLKSR